MNNLYQLIKEREEALMSVTPASSEIKAYDYQIAIQKSLLMAKVSRSILDQVE